MNEPIRFDHVVIFKPVFFVVIGVLVMAPLVYCIGSILPFTGARLLGAFIGLLGILFVCWAFSKNIVIAFDANQIRLKINKKVICYNKSDVIGFYSFDYKTASVFTISICIYFKDGKKLNISDFKLKPASFDYKRKAQLINFIVAMEHELGFKALKENNTRKFLRIGYTWFSR